MSLPASTLLKALPSPPRWLRDVLCLHPRVADWNAREVLDAGGYTLLRDRQGIPDRAAMRLWGLSQGLSRGADALADHRDKASADLHPDAIAALTLQQIRNTYSLPVRAAVQLLAAAQGALIRQQLISTSTATATTASADTPTTTATTPASRPPAANNPGPLGTETTTATTNPTPTATATPRPVPVLPPPPTVAGQGVTAERWTVVYDGNKQPTAIRVPVQKQLITLAWETYEWLLDAYSKWTGPGAPIAEVADKLQLQPRTTQQLIRQLNLAHWSAPIPDHRIATEDEDALVEEIAAKKRASLYSKTEARVRRQIERDAQSWAAVDLSIRRTVAEVLGPLAARPVVPARPLPAPREPWGLVVTLADVHVGKYGPTSICGPHAASTARCIHDVTTALDDLLSRVRTMGRPEVVHLVFHGDYFNADTADGTTTAGTVQRMDGDASEEIRAGLELGIEAIERARSVGAPVTVWVTPGNHDRRTLQIAGEAWRFYYRGCPDVDVQVCLAPRTYTRFGTTLLVLAHGDGQKPADLPALAAQEARSLIGQTTHTLALVGHFHHQKRTRPGDRKGKHLLEDHSGVVVVPQVAEEHPVTVEVQPSVSGEDAWHTRAGYVGSERAVAGYLLSERRGRIGYLLGLPKSERRIQELKAAAFN